MHLALIAALTGGSPHGGARGGGGDRVWSGGGKRVYHVPACGANYTLSELQSVFTAHAFEWDTFGRTRPWWSVLTERKYLTRAPSRKTLADFYETGRPHVARVLRDLGLASVRGLDVLDLGCGVGRLALHFAAGGARSVACVDQSPAHLTLARQQLLTPSAHGGRGLAPAAAARVRFVVTSVDLLAAVGGRERFDLVHSVISLQHAVAPLQAALLEQLCDALRVGGVGWLQLPFELPQPAGAACDLEASRRAGSMQMHASPIRAIRQAVEARGCAAAIDDVGAEFLGSGAAEHRRSAVVRLRKRAY